MAEHEIAVNEVLSGQVMEEAESASAGYDHAAEATKPSEIDQMFAMFYDLISDKEQLDRVPELIQLRNIQFKQMNKQAACDMYSEAIGILGRPLLKEKPHSTEWKHLHKLKIPFLLNYSQSKLNQGDFYAVIEDCSSVLKDKSDNAKALFRRGKAHVGAWNSTEAGEDFEKVIGLD
ncbi:hypothetical protein FQA39_LY13215 [Lamprigera yunnana]|nr:hypothetical protein FQA39_LY13215 [Lamprigera yunnana]